MPTPSKPSELLKKQAKFARLLAQLITWIFAQGWEITLGEGFVGTTDAADGDYDGPHMRNGAHYTKLGMDLSLFVAGEYKKAACPEWSAIGAKWKSLDSEARWGGDFSSGDLNHVSLLYQGKA
jgi:hypothetical protein